MKKLILYLFLTSFVFVGCEDFLDETPDAFRTPQGFFEKESEVTQAVSAIYRTNGALHGGYGNARLQLRFGESRSDNTNIEVTGDGGGIDDDRLNEFTMEATNGRIGAYWSTNYEGISRANYVLANFERATYNDMATKDFREGEALFFRALFHFNLVRVYGDIPYVTQAGETPEQIVSEEFTERDPVAEVYENLLTDVNRAITLLPNPNNLAAEDVGRATRGAALMLKAKILMAQQNYADAIQPLEQIRSFGYQLLGNYSDIFGTKNHAEGIFEIQFDFNLNQTGNFFTNFVPASSGETILGTGNTPNNRGNQFQPTSELIALYSDDDQRKAHNISIFVDGGGNEIPWGSKFAFPFVEQGQQDINWQMYRYADALLMLAECYERAGGGDPVAILVQIRTRAGLADPNLSAEELADLEQTIADERRRELAFEGHRFFDLLRTGKLVEVMSAHGAQQVADGLTVTDGAYQNIRTVVGLPQAQIDQFGLQQNPGW
ncbi:RagB/SusD family nutrient uptake outer membrane protein [Flavobacteriaceae bacterium M23B6Z8]